MISVCEEIQLRDALRRKGLKATPRRLAVAGLLATTGRALTAETVHARLLPKLGRLGLQTVYRVLEELAEVGLLTRIERADRLRCYAICRAESNVHHHHIVCTDCGRVEVVDCIFPVGYRRRIERRTGFRVNGHSMQVAGVCPGCQERGGR